jgi:hypothetical protein
MTEVPQNDGHPDKAKISSGPLIFLKKKLQCPFFIWSVALAVVLFILLHESIFCGKGLVPADGVLFYPPWNETAGPANGLLFDQYCDFIPQHEFVYKQIWQGHFPLWNPYLECGVPNLGWIQGALFFPVQLLFSPVDPFYASGWAAFLKLFLAGLFTMLYLRQLGVCDSAAFLSGVVFCLSGFMIVWLGHPHVNCAMWLPLLLYFVEKSSKAMSGENSRLLAAPNLLAWMGFAVALGFMILGGHPPTAIHVAILVTIYFLFRHVTWGKTQPVRRIYFFCFSFVTGLFLAAPQIIPFLDFLRLSSKNISSDNLQQLAAHLTPVTLVHFLLPRVSGSPSIGFEDLPGLLGLNEPDNFNERTGYIGILPLFLVLCAAVYRRCSLTIFYLSIALVSLLVIYGVWPFPAITQSLPILSHTSQTRLLLFVCFSAAVLAGLGWDTLIQMEDRRKVFWSAAAFGFVVVGTLLFFGEVVRLKFHELDSMHRNFLMMQFFVPVGGIVASFLVVLCPARWGRWTPTAICLGCIIGDLLGFGMGYNPSIAHESYYPSTGAIKWLQQDSSIFRILGSRSIFVPNTPEVFNLNDARGFGAMSVQRYEELINGRAGGSQFYAYAPSLPQSFQLLNVKYLLSHKSDTVNSNLFERVYSGEIDIYRYKAWRERALLVFDYQVDPQPSSILDRVRSGAFDPAKTLLLETDPEKIERPGQNMILTNNITSSVRITSYQPDEVKIEASLARPGFLLLLDTYFPGWSATVNGQNAPIYRADYNFRAVSLPAGNSSVIFSYQPASLRIGMALFVTGLLMLAVTWFWSRNNPLG